MKTEVAAKPLKIILQILITGVVLLFAWVLAYPVAAGVIPHGVSIGGVDVQKMKPERANRKLMRDKRFQTPKILKIQAGDNKYDIALRELEYELPVREFVEEAARHGRGRGPARFVSARLGALFSDHDIAVRARYDAKAARDFIKLIKKKSECRPVSARIDWKTFKIIPHKNGHKMDEQKSLAALEQALGWYDGRRVKLAVKTTRPRVLTADLDAIDFKKPLAVFSTKYEEGQINRSKNLKRIAELLTGHEILPGATFSYNEIVGERTPENGFFLAPEINEGRMQLAYGGGACQGSTTLFNVVLLAGFDKFDWWPHSRRSHYADPGRDATVYYGQIDLKFRNPHKESVYIYATAEKGVLTFKLFSRHKLKYKVKLSSKWWGAWWPGEERKVVSNLAAGKTRVVSSGAEGMRAALYRTFIYPGGKKVTKRMSNKGGKILIYHGAKRIVEVGAGSPDAPKPAASKPAAPAAGAPAGDVAP